MEYELHINIYSDITTSKEEIEKIREKLNYLAKMVTSFNAQT